MEKVTSKQDEVNISCRCLLQDLFKRIKRVITDHIFFFFVTKVVVGGNKYVERIVLRIVRNFHKLIYKKIN